jgi:hypothetical protein
VEDHPITDEMTAHRDDGHRALGRYVTVFSQLVLTMRDMMVRHLGRPQEKPRIAELAFGGVTAEPITNAFFAMSRMLMNHEADELKTAAKLRSEVTDALSLRNRILHGDWYIGYWSTTGGDPSPPKLVAPWVEHVVPSRTKNPFAPVEVNLDQESDHLERLALLVQEYGRVCFGLHYLQRQGRGGVRVAEVVLIRKVPHGKDWVVPGPKASHSTLQAEFRNDSM